MNTHDITAFIRSEGRVRFDQQLRMDMGWETVLDESRLSHFLSLAAITQKSDTENLLFNLGAGDVKGAQVMVEIFDDRVEIYNPGGLPKGLSEKDFGKRSVCRNPNIADLLVRCDYIEKMGSGIERIYEALEKENCPPVKIDYTTMFSLVFPMQSYIAAQDMEKPREKTRMKSRVKPMVKTRDIILDLIRANPDITIARLAEGTSLTTKGIEWQITRLKEKGSLERIGKASSGHWKVKDNKGK